MEKFKNFFSFENIREIFEKTYIWLENILDKIFGGIKYEPIKELLTNPWFWIILIILFILSRIFRRR